MARAPTPNHNLFGASSRRTSISDLGLSVPHSSWTATSLKLTATASVIPSAMPLSARAVYWLLGGKTCSSSTARAGTDAKLAGVTVRPGSTGAATHDEMHAKPRMLAPESELRLRSCTCGPNREVQCGTAAQGLQRNGTEQGTGGIRGARVWCTFSRSKAAEVAGTVNCTTTSTSASCATHG